MGGLVHACLWECVISWSDRQYSLYAVVPSELGLSLRARSPHTYVSGWSSNSRQGVSKLLISAASAWGNTWDNISHGPAFFLCWNHYVNVKRKYQVHCSDKAGREKGLFGMLQSLQDSHFLTGGIGYLWNWCLGIQTLLSWNNERRGTQAIKATLKLPFLPLSYAFLILINEEKVSELYHLDGM